MKLTERKVFAAGGMDSDSTPDEIAPNHPASSCILRARALRRVAAVPGDDLRSIRIPQLGARHFKAIVMEFMTTINWTCFVHCIRMARAVPLA